MTIGDFKLFLVCAQCTGRYPLVNTSGFSFADGVAIVSVGRVEICPLCYYHHPATSRIHLARVQEDTPAWIT